MEDLGAAAFLPTAAFMGLGMAMANGRASAACARAADAQERLADASQATDIALGGMRSFAKSATYWQGQTILADAEIRRLRECNDDLVFERSDLIAAIADLMAENDELIAAAAKARRRSA